MVLHVLVYGVCLRSNPQPNRRRRGLPHPPSPSIPSPPPSESLPLLSLSFLLPPLSSVFSSLPPPQTRQASAFRAPVLIPAHTQKRKQTHNTKHKKMGQEAAESSPEAASSRKPLLPGCCSSACLLAQGVLVPLFALVLVCSCLGVLPSSSGSLVAFSHCSFIYQEPSPPSYMAHAQEGRYNPFTLLSAATESTDL